MSTRIWELEQLRQARWHATYNATVTAILAGSIDSCGLFQDWKETTHLAAAALADRAHGPLPEKDHDR